MEKRLTTTKSSRLVKARSYQNIITKTASPAKNNSCLLKLQTSLAKRPEIKFQSNIIKIQQKTTSDHEKPPLPRQAPKPSPRPSKLLELYDKDVLVKSRS